MFTKKIFAVLLSLSVLINFMLGEGEDLAKNFGFDTYKEYLFYILDGAPKSNEEIPKATEETKTIRLSTTTSVNDSGLLSYLLPVFENKLIFDNFKPHIYGYATCSVRSFML